MALTTGLVSYYSFDTDTSDDVGSNDFTNSGASQVTGKIGNAYSFNGTSNYMYNSDAADYNDNTFSVSFWLKSDGTTDNKDVVGTKDATKSWALRTDTNGDRTTPTGDKFAFLKKFVAYNGFNTHEFSTGTWEHYVIVLNGNNVSLWKNGVEDANTNSDVMLTDNTGLLLAANQYPSPSSYWAGDIDELGFWSRVLTSTEISELYNSGDGLAYPFLNAVPQQPTNLVATAASSSQIDLTWTDNSSGSSQESGFVIQRSRASDSGFVTVHTTAADATSWSDTGLPQKETYWYRVYGTNSIGDGVVSDTDGAQTLETQDTDRGGETAGMAEIKRAYPVTSGLALANKHEGRVFNLTPQGHLGVKSTVSEDDKVGI